MRLYTAESRDVFIDNVKGVLIFLVVLGHVIGIYTHENFGLFMLWICVYCFHMPLFVYISGVLSKDMEKAGEKPLNGFYCRIWSEIRSRTY
jgi:fucose 4-O-acetylase-like acetyltransferase